MRAIGAILTIVTATLVAVYPSPGQAQSDPANQLPFVEVQTIGGDFGLDVISSAVADTEGNTFVLDTGRQRVIKFTPTGRVAAAAEVCCPTAMTISGANEIYIAHFGGVVSVLDNNLTLLRKEHNVFDGVTRSIKVDEGGNLLVSYLDIVSHKVIHRHPAGDGTPASFCPSYAKGRNVDAGVEIIYGGGYIDIAGDNSIYFLQAAPFEIKRFSADGSLIATIDRDESVVPPPPDSRTPDRSLKFTPFASATRSTPTSILVLNDGSVVGTVLTPSDGNDGAPGRTTTFLFDEDGNRVASHRIDGCLLFAFTDAKGDIYVIDNSPSSHLVRRWRAEHPFTRG